jgi:hypothetical protein
MIADENITGLDGGKHFLRFALMEDWIKSYDDYKDIFPVPLDCLHHYLGMLGILYFRLHRVQCELNCATQGFVASLLDSSQGTLIESYSLREYTSTLVQSMRRRSTIQKHLLR